MSEEFITTDLQLPCHENELSQAEEYIEKIKVRIDDVFRNKAINGVNHTELYEDVMRVLDYVGGLSMPAFQVGDDLERMYVMQYIHSPELAKTLWLRHFQVIHRPYNVLKNRCFRLLEELDDNYKKLHKCNPPNWNP